jgi:transposase
MTKTYKTYLPEQDLLLPPRLRDWLPEDHLVYCVSDVVDELDLSAIESVYEEEDRGQPPYHPRMMTKILVYGYCVGVFSSRRIQKRLAEDLASAYWPPAISRISGPYRIFGNCICKCWKDCSSRCCSWC